MDLPLITLRGTPTEMGEQHGKQLRPVITAFVHERLRAARAYLYERGSRDMQALQDIATTSLKMVASWHPDGYAEHCATAEAAGLNPVELYLATNLTDMRDAHLLAEPGSTAPADAEGCTCVAVPPSLTAAGAWLVGQTWDLNPGDLDAVVAIHRLPENGPETWSVTCAGSLSLVGVNQHGVMVGTTNIKTTGSRPGIGYLSLLHRALTTSNTRSAAADVIEQAPRAAAHTYLTADQDGATHFECTATTAVRREIDSQPLVQTNHCLVAEHQAREGEPASSSSLTRLETARARLASGSIDQPSLVELFAEREAGIDSINRYPEDGTGTATNSCLICEPASGKTWACRGPADRGVWIELGFERR